MGKACTKRGTFALVDLVIDDLADQRLDSFLQNISGSVSAFVVNDNDFLVGDLGLTNTVDYILDVVFFVITGDDNR